MLAPRSRKSAKNLKFVQKYIPTLEVYADLGAVMAGSGQKKGPGLPAKIPGA